MKKAGILFSLLLVIFLTTGVCGCNMNKNFTKQEIAVEHLQNKYNENFTVISYESRNIDMPYDMVICQNDSGEKVKVFLNSESDNLNIVDDYYGSMIKEEFEALISDIIDDYIDDFKVFSGFTASYYDNAYTKRADFKVALEQTKEQFFSRTYIFIDEASLNRFDADSFESMCFAIKEQNVTMFIAIYAVTEEDFKNINEDENVNMYLPDDYRSEPCFKKTIK